MFRVFPVVVLAAVTIAAAWPKTPTPEPLPQPAHHDAQGVIVFFPRSICPSDFTELSNSRGRVVVALSAAGSPAATVGAALPEQGLQRTMDLVAHTHAVDAPATTSSSDTHNHLFDLAINEQPGGSANGAQGNSGPNSTVITSSREHTHSFSFPTINTASAGKPEGADVTMPYVQLLACESSGALNAFPAGATAFVSTASCPLGWSELSAAQGRVVVGAADTGMVGTTVGAALNDQGLRTTDQIVSHVHSVDPPEVTSSAAGAHNHTVGTQNAESEGANEGFLEQTAQASNSGDTFNSAHTHSVNIPSTTSTSAGSSGSDMDVTTPYIQLLLCRRDG